MTTTINASTTLGLQQTADTSGVLALQTANTTALTLDASQNATFAGYVNAPNTFGFKNRLLNGGMVIDQRNAGASVTPTTAQYTLDRWKFILTQNSKFTAQQNAGSVTPPVGFSNYLGVTSSSAYSVTASDYFTLYQIIEGFNVSDLAWGTANAKAVTLSFWVRSSLTGTFGGSVINTGATNASYPFSYSISSANTWTQISVTIAGDTTVVPSSGNAGALQVAFGLGMGSDWTATANAWTSGYKMSPTGATSVVGTNGATFYITGVQLEKGTQATSFDFRSYGTELALCQRYFYRLVSGSNYAFMNCAYQSSVYVEGYVPFTVEMRAAPTVSVASGAYYTILRAGAADILNTLSTELATTTGTALYNTTEASGTTGYGGFIYTSNAAAFVGFSSEL